MQVVRLPIEAVPLLFQIAPPATGAVTHKSGTHYAFTTVVISRIAEPQVVTIVTTSGGSMLNLLGL